MQDKMQLGGTFVPTNRVKRSSPNRNGNLQFYYVIINISSIMFHGQDTYDYFPVNLDSFPEYELREAGRILRAARANCAAMVVDRATLRSNGSMALTYR